MTAQNGLSGSLQPVQQQASNKQRPSIYQQHSENVKRGLNGLPLRTLAGPGTAAFLHANDKNSKSQVLLQEGSLLSETFVRQRASHILPSVSEPNLTYLVDNPPGAQSSSNALPSIKSTTAVFNTRESAIIEDAKKRFALSADHIRRKTSNTGDGNTYTRQTTMDADAVDLSPELSNSSPALNPVVAKQSSVHGFLHYMNRDDSAPPARTRASASGGLPSILLKVPAEDALITIASRMGVVRKVSEEEHLAHSSHGGAGAKQKAARGTATVTQVSPLGISYKAFEKFVDSVRNPDWTTRDVVAQVIGAATRQLRCRYCDLLSDKALDVPTLYIIHCWGNSWTSLVEGIRSYVHQLRTTTDDVFIWLDIFCVNQYCAITASDLPLLRDVISSSERSLVILDKQATVLRRTWCLWEMHEATIISLERKDRMMVIPTNWNWDHMLHTFLSFDPLHSETQLEKDKPMLLSDMTRNTDLGSLPALIRESMVVGCKREMQRSEKLGSVNPKRFGTAASAYANMLCLSSKYGEAEDVMRQVMRMYDRFGGRDIGEKEQASTSYHLAIFLREQGRLPDAERVLQEFVNQFRGMQEELYMDGVAALSDILTQRKYYTKAEMLARKMLEEKVKMYGKTHHQVVSSMLQLANISASQKLFEEAEQHLREALHAVGEIYGTETAESAAAYHMMATCSFSSNRTSEAKLLLDKSLGLRIKIFGADHPTTLDSKAFLAEILVKEKRFKDAEHLLTNIYRSRLKTYGPEHPTVLSSVGQLADLLRDLQKDDEADEMERKIIQAGRQLLRYNKIDKFRSLNYVTSYLAEREHLLDKAAMFLAKAFIVFKEKLGSEHDLSAMTKTKLMEIIDKVKWIGSNSLEQAQIFNSSTQFGVAEVMFKQAYSISKLVSPESDHKTLAQGLADALFGQGKIQEAKTIMRAAGLSRKGMKQNMPASYLRWLNTRVAKYMDKTADEEEDGDM